MNEKLFSIALSTHFYRRRGYDYFYKAVRGKKMHTITFAHENDSLIIFIERDIDHHNAAKLRNEIDETMSLIS
ncbi:MAG: hypothetical protein RSD08_06510, partial [Oscillospiraceae bacterium]